MAPPDCANGAAAQQNLLKSPLNKLGTARDADTGIQFNLAINSGPRQKNKSSTFSEDLSNLILS